MAKVFVKNMVCDRCISSVRRILDRQNLAYQKVQLGEIELAHPLTAEQSKQLSGMLLDEGFELLLSETPILVAKIKSALIKFYQQDEISDDFKLSDFLTALFPYDYAHMSRTFSQSEGQTLEQYHIKLRIEKAKELLTYKEQNMSEVAFSLGYKSIAHFSRQFKKWTGHPPSSFHQNKGKRNSLNEI